MSDLARLQTAKTSKMPPTVVTQSDDMQAGFDTLQESEYQREPSAQESNMQASSPGTELQAVAIVQEGLEELDGLLFHKATSAS